MRVIGTLSILGALLLIASLVSPGFGQKKEPVELGAVRWQRDFDAALAKSAETGKPLFVQFQEVPG